MMDVVYHYTSAEVLLKIFESDQIWATNIRYLNDHTERQFFLNELRTHIPSFLQNQGPMDTGVFDRFLQEAGDTPSFLDLPFVTSFSAERDSLPQWRSYCSRGNGVAIGFRTEALKRGSVEVPPMLKIGGTSIPMNPMVSFEKVKYLEKGDTDYLDAHLKASLEEAEKLYEESMDSLEEDEAPPTIEDLAYYTLEKALALTKDAAFKAESEYRLSVVNHFGSRKALNYRASKSTIVPYMELKVPSPEKLLGSLKVSKFTRPAPHFIHDVVVGPSANQDLTIEALQAMFRFANHLIPVEASRVPFRDWL